MRVTLAIVAAILLSSGAASAAPSFDCNRAQSISEREVCRVPALQWLDRQLAHLYNEVRLRGGQALINGQRAFLVRRESCVTNVECIERVYGERLLAIGRYSDTTDPVGRFRPTRFGGEMWVVRYGGLTGAIQILSVGDGGHTCVFETDNATQTGKGVLKAVERGDDGACRLNVIPDGNDQRVETQNCQSFCGMRSIMDGLYRRVGP
jgi:uncharacterized protein